MVNFATIWYMFCQAGVRNQKDLSGLCICKACGFRQRSCWIAGSRILRRRFNGSSANWGPSLCAAGRIYGDIVITLKNFYGSRKSRDVMVQRCRQVSENGFRGTVYSDLLFLQPTPSLFFFLIIFIFVRRLPYNGVS
ncbi:hypothetical protein CDAR_180311 [Caerostris darwini]|uniref:Uncharacterized protein n=1 Tax=Caerostris darwini TaxID=1538125 RepID=A0AAV4NRI4_9ARAC|nr:hypothetical protein CDAR_180311 [Caerostris darwini]